MMLQKTKEHSPNWPQFNNRGTLGQKKQTYY